jgi:hypothetical protein
MSITKHKAADVNQHRRSLADNTARNVGGGGGAKYAMDISSQVKKIERGNDWFEPDLNVHITFSATPTLIVFAALKFSSQTNFLGKKNIGGREFAPPSPSPSPHKITRMLSIMIVCVVAPIIWHANRIQVASYHI